MRVLITGGSGFIGTNLVEHYRAAGHDVVSLDIAPPKRADHAALHKKVDILDRAALTAAIAEFDPELLFHLAARTDLHGRTEADYAANSVGVENLMDAIGAAPSLTRLLVASSRLVCEIGYQPTSDTDYRPTTPYGESKVRTEQIVRAADPSVPWTLVRPTSIWGPWFGAPYDLFFRLIAKGFYAHPSGMKIHKSFGFVGNTVYELEKLAGAGNSTAGKTLYLCDYPPIEVSQWAQTIRAALDAPPVRQAPYAVLRSAALAGDLLAKAGLRNPPLTTFRLNNLLCEMVHPTADLEAICGPLPYSAEQGVAMTAAWINSQKAASPAEAPAKQEAI